MQLSSEQDGTTSPLPGRVTTAQNLYTEPKQVVHPKQLKAESQMVGVMQNTASLWRCVGNEKSVC